MSQQEKPQPKTKKDAEREKKSGEELSEEALDGVGGGARYTGDSSDPQEGGEIA